VFKKLLNQPNKNITVLEYTTVEQVIKKSSSEEVNVELDMLKNGKARRNDEIVSERLKKGGQGLLN